MVRSGAPRYLSLQRLDEEIADIEAM